jgi:hypothetical protein
LAQKSSGRALNATDVGFDRMSDRFYCLVCHRWVGPHRRAGTLYCSARCRQRAYRERLRADEQDEQDAIPAPLILDDAARKRLQRELATKSFADARRHGGAGTSLHADHLRWASWTREVLGRFLRRRSTAIQQGVAPSVPDAEDGSPAG